MRSLLQTISALSLVATILPAILFFSGALELNEVKWAMLISTVVWFIATPLWMTSKSH